jgi:hypothetical protein
MLAAWVVFPLLLGALSVGCGLLVEQGARTSIPGALIAPLGLATIIVESALATTTDTTSELAVPLVVLLAVTGFALAARAGRSLVPDRVSIAVGAGVFIVLALPVVASGDATFAGYIKLDDTSTWLAITDHVMHHGRHVSGLAPSSYEATLALNIGDGHGYPIGAFLPLGIGAGLLPTDAAWLFQPYESFLAAMLALALYELTGRMIERRALRAAVAFIAAQPALLFAYVMWGGVKEIASAALIALFAASLQWLLDDFRFERAVVPALTSAALLAVLSFGGAVWIALPLIGAAAVATRTRSLGRIAVVAGSYLAAGAAFALPSLLTAKGFLEPAKGVVTDANELGNLIEPLEFIQVAGVWPAGDFRVDPTRLGFTHFLIFIVAAAALAGTAAAVRARAWGLAIFVPATFISCVLVVRLGSPWIDAKALATASPAVVVAALAACAYVYERGYGAPAAAMAVLIGGGVLWSNALAFHDVSLAPRDRFHELELIGNRIGGQGPTLMNEYEPYGARHFLRRGDPEGASELRRRVVQLRAGGYLGKGGYADVDAFTLDAVLTYRSLVLRRGPGASRPPSVYKRTWHGRYYDLWQRPAAGGARIVEHLPLGDNSTQPGAPAPCAQVRRLARLVPPGGSLGAASADTPSIVQLGGAGPRGWQPDASNASVVTPVEDGELRTTISTGPGPRDLWLGGSVRRKLTVTLDGRRVAGVRHELNPSGGYIPLGRVDAGPGTHRVSLRVVDSSLHPGGGGPQLAIGPLAASAPDDDRPVMRVAPQDARSLCGRNLDWIEAVGP